MDRFIKKMCVGGLTLLQIIIVCVIIAVIFIASPLVMLFFILYLLLSYAIGHFVLKRGELNDND